MIESVVPMGSAVTHGYNADDKQQVTVAQKLDEKRQQQAAEDLAKLLDMEEGRRFITRVLQLTGLNVLSEPDAVLCQRSEGARSVGIELCAILNRHSIHAYPRLLTEAAMRAEVERQEREIAIKALEQERGGLIQWASRKLGLNL